MVFKTIPFGRSGISPLEFNRPLVHRELCETAKRVVKNGWKNMGAIHHPQERKINRKSHWLSPVRPGLHSRRASA